MILDFHGSPKNSDGQLTVNAAQHRNALAGRTDAHGRALIAAWEAYADAHRERFEDNIGNDFVLGAYWAEVGLAIKRLLDGETGGLDCGSIAHNITAAIEAQDFKTDGYTLTESE